MGVFGAAAVFGEAGVRIKGITAIDRFDNELTLSSLTGIKKSADFRKLRTDNHEHKRVELHCHTKMSDMDGVAETGGLYVKYYIKVIQALFSGVRDDFFQVVYQVSFQAVNDCFIQKTASAKASPVPLP